MDSITKSSIFLIVLMFIISGGNKAISLGTSEMQRFSIKTGININLSRIIVLFAGIYELISSFFVLYGSFYDNPEIAKLGSYMLILFTFLATLIFYTFPIKYKPLLSNLSVISGLYLMINICFFKNKKLS